MKTAGRTVSSKSRTTSKMLTSKNNTRYIAQWLASIRSKIKTNYRLIRITNKIMTIIRWLITMKRYKTNYSRIMLTKLLMLNQTRRYNVKSWLTGMMPRLMTVYKLTKTPNSQVFTPRNINYKMNMKYPKPKPLNQKIMSFKASTRRSHRWPM